MKILSENSILKTLPFELEHDKFLIFDSLRFTFEIIEHNYTELEKNLLLISETEKKNISATFNYAWGIIDNSSRLVKICEQLPWENKNEIIGNLSHINDFRNTYQHLGERIYESLLKTSSPFYGVLIWFYKNLETEDFIPTMAISGVSKEPFIEYKVPDLTSSTSKINNVIVQTVNKKELIRTDLTFLVQDLKNLCLNLENRLTKFCLAHNLESLNWKRRQDIVIKLVQEKKK